MSQLAQSAAFTTLPWRWGATSHDVAHCRAHLRRLWKHANRLGIPVGADFALRLEQALHVAVEEHNQAETPPGTLALLRVEVAQGGAVGCRFRARTAPPLVDGEGVRAVCWPGLPQWGLGIAGCKHGDWQAYLNAMQAAREAGAACALLIGEEEFVVDASHVTPLLSLPGPEHFKKIYFPDPEAGAVDSVTLRGLQPWLEAAGFVLCPERLSLEEVLHATEMVLVGSGVDVVPVHQVQTLDGTVHAVGQPRGPLLTACRTALDQARADPLDGWAPWPALLRAARALPADAAAHCPVHWRLEAPGSESLLLHAAEALRAAGLFGAGAEQYGGPDELMLVSGGPCSDVARFSLLAGPPTIRFRAHQPPAVGDGGDRRPPDSVPSAPSALEGHLTLEDPAAPLEWTVERWAEGADPQWVADPHHRVVGPLLGTTMRAISAAVPNCWALGAGLPVNVGTLAGHLGYDLFQWTQPLRPRYPPPPATLIGLLYGVHRWVIHDRLEGVLHVIGPPNDAWAFRCQAVLPSCWDGRPSPPASPVLPLANGHGAHASPPPAPAAAGAPALWSTTDDAQHAERVERVKQCIRDGHLYQLNYARRWFGTLPDTPALAGSTGMGEGDLPTPWEVMAQLVRRNPAPFGAWLLAPDCDFALVSCSPELLLAQSGRRVSTRPIKGTSSRGRTEEEDTELIHEMVCSEKETAEHLMLVDLERNDLGSICSPGTVRWSLWRVESYPNVHHLVSEVAGDLHPALDGLDALDAVFPGGSITGCPKTATIAAIDELERDSRQAWTGSMGYFDARTRRATWSILIRTLQGDRAAGAWRMRLLAGGGLTIGSDPLAEVHECKLKALAIAAAGWGPQGEDDLMGTAVGAGLRQKTLCRINRDNIQILAVPAVNARVDAILRGLRREQARRRPIGGAGGPPRPRTVPFPLPAGLPLGDDNHDGRPRVIFVDNLDSFSWNIVSALAELGGHVFVVPGRGHHGQEFHDAEVDALLQRLRPTHVVLGPGPGRPEFSWLTMTLAARAVAGTLPVPCLGICLGHQALGLCAGYAVVPAPLGPVHGVPDFCTFDGACPLFHSMASPCIMTRYHSLVIQDGPDCPLAPVAWAAEGPEVIMAVQHNSRPVWGVQFHPESAGSHEGHQLFQNFLSSPAP
eukprot:EG_transcript_1014